jgi:membrane protease YdiL (CAAX protease family)
MVGNTAGWRMPTGLALLAICLAVLGWELVIPAALILARPELSELWLYGIDKIGFAIVLARILAMRGLWRRCGFAGGLPSAAAGLLWPLWLISALSAVQGFADDSTGQLLGWFAISTAVGFGEEGVFRGLIIALLGPGRPRHAVAVSSLLFGGLHLAGLLAPIDFRYVLAQAVAATCLGLVLGCTRLLAGSIWPGILAHAVLDFFGLAAAGSVSSAAKFSSGAAFIILGSALVALLWAAVLWRRLPASD